MLRLLRTFYDKSVKERGGFEKGCDFITNMKHTPGNMELFSVIIPRLRENVENVIPLEIKCYFHYEMW